MGLNCEPRDVWMLADSTTKGYYERLNQIHLAAGFADAAKGYCPALVAETLQTEAEWALILAAEQFFPGVTNDRLLCGITRADGSRECGLETRNRYIDLQIGLVVNSPGYVSPLKRGAA
jgi:hypothetical protein